MHRATLSLQLAAQDVASLVTAFLLESVVMLVIVYFSYRKRLTLSILGAFLTACFMTLMSLALVARGLNAALLTLASNTALSVVLLFVIAAQVRAGLTFWLGLVTAITSLVAPTVVSGGPVIRGILRGVFCGSASILSYSYRQWRRRRSQESA